MDTKNKPPLLVSTRQLADLLQCGDATVKRLADEGKIPFINLTPRTRRFDPECVREALRRMSDQGGSES